MILIVWALRGGFCIVSYCFCIVVNQKPDCSQPIKDCQAFWILLRSYEKWQSLPVCAPMRSVGRVVRVIRLVRIVKLYKAHGASRLCCTTLHYIILYRPTSLSFTCESLVFALTLLRSPECCWPPSNELIWFNGKTMTGFLSHLLQAAYERLGREPKKGTQQCGSPAEA